MSDRPPSPTPPPTPTPPARAEGPSAGVSHSTWQGIPCVDLAALNAGDGTAREVFRDAFVRFGFVRLTSHGVSDDLLRRVDEAFGRFFDLPEARKLESADVAGGQRGYTPHGVEHARDRTRPDLKAFYHVGQPRPQGPAAGEYPANVFPADAPDFDAPEFEASALALYAALERVAAIVLEELEVVFDLPPGVWSDMIRGGNSILRALDYPPLDAGELETEEREGDSDGRALRAAPHEDINLVTLLPAASDGGLEIWADGAWLPVHARPGELIADVGDMLARVTGGRLPATTHRVVVDSTTASRRRSAYPFFAHPRPECDLSVRPEFVAPGEVPPHPPITAGDFLRERLVEIGLLSDA